MDVKVGVREAVNVGVNVGVGVGRHSAPELEPGMLVGGTLVEIVPALPAVAP